MRINLIVFSKDRPMQLEATLRSVQKNAPDVFGPVAVIYKATSEDFRKGYDVVRRTHPEVLMVPETEFKSNILNALQQGEYVCFLTDDDIVYQPVDPKIFEVLETNPDMFCVSLRLGRNTNFCYPANQPEKAPEFEVSSDGFLKWEWENAEFDFGYPLSVTAHVFRANKIYEFSSDIQFKNPNTYEAEINKHRKDITQKWMRCPEQSCVVGIPANRVNDVFQNRNGLQYGYTVEELNDAFLDGKRIDFEKMDFSNVFGSQQEFKYEFFVLKSWWDRNTNISEFVSWVGPHDSPSKKEVRSHIAKKTYQNVLDCGAGVSTEFFGFKEDGFEIEYTSLDITEQFVEYAKSKGVNALLGSIYQIPFPDSAFDIVMTRHVLEHLKYYEKPLSEMIRAAKKEVIVTFFFRPGSNTDSIRFKGRDIDVTSPADNIEGDGVYHNVYNRNKMTEFILKNPKVEQVVWQDFGQDESILHIYLK